MRNYIFIAAGAMLGAVLRFATRNLLGGNLFYGIPMDTLLINIAGSFVLVFFLGLSYELWGLNADIRLGISTGVVGAFTTFSAFSKELAVLLWQHQYWQVGVYMLLSVGLGLLFAYVGDAAAKAVLAKARVKKPEKQGARTMVKGEAE